MLYEPSLSELPRLMDWIKTNRKKDAFKDYNDYKILCCIFDSIKESCFLVTKEGNQYTGVVCGKISRIDRFVYIHDILTINKWSIRAMLTCCNDRFPSFKILGKVRNRQRQFKNAEMLLNTI